MDAIEALDEGAYAHFDHQITNFPEITNFMAPAYYYSNSIGIAVLFAIVMLLFFVQGRSRGAFVALVSFASAIVLIQTLRVLVPRPHPANADRWLGADAQTGTYPSAPVFLFTLCLILLGFALKEYADRTWMRFVFVVISAALVGWVCMAGFYLALHYVTDVIGALAGAALIGWITSRFIDSEAPPRPAAV
ncbi:MAG TPA: hypothetical protein VFE62_09355 [Gemmataceae bacterium]|nr:hypothetical protein [Gemmataceae bacterium]